MENSEPKFKVKLMKVKNTINQRQYNDYYDDVSRLAAINFSDWEEVTQNEKDTLWQWVSEHKDYLLFVYSEEEKLEFVAIKEQIAWEAALRAKREKEKKAREQADLEKRKKATERKIQKAKDLLAKLQNPTPIQ
jgi:hypothetical protein